jgi:glutaredoxin 3
MTVSPVSIILSLLITESCAFAPSTTTLNHAIPTHSSSGALYGMKRPILDRVASSLFNLEMDRVESSSVTDDKGRSGEPMEWSKEDSVANKFSEVVASNGLGYAFKQWVADIVAGDYDRDEVQKFVEEFVNTDSDSGQTKVAMFSFTTCPFCRAAKDYLDEEGIEYKVLELDELEGNRGNEIRATLGTMIKRTSVPSIFIKGEPIGGMNDGMPGLMPLAKNGQLKSMLL